MEGSSKVSNGALIVSIVLALIVIGLSIAIVVLSCQTSDSTFPWPKMGCVSNKECGDKLCNGTMGCCAVCSKKTGKCERGMLTADGCKQQDPPKLSARMDKPNPRPKPNSKPKPKPNSNPKPKPNPNPQPTPDTEPAFSQSNMAYTQANAPPGSADKSHAYCTAKMFGPNVSGEEGSGCAVSQNNTCVPGVVSPSGGCQTAVQQDAWANWGSDMPNTYLISTSGPVLGATMGGCSVRGIGSSIQNYVGFFDSCSPKAPVPNYGREYASDFAAPNYSSCG
jgi:hypothetical protein